MTPRAIVSLSLLLFAGVSALADPPSAPADLTSKFASELDMSSLPAAPAPATPPSLLLNFSVVHTYRYFYHQAVENHINGPENGKASDFSSASDGDLMVYAEPDHTAQVRFEKLRVHSTATSDGKPQQFNQKVEPTWIGNLNQAGGFDEAETGQRPLMELLFPVVSKPLAVGESTDAAVEYDLSVMGNVYPTKGVRHITCTGYATVAKRLCAKLEQTVRLSVVDDEKHLRIDATGKSVCFFAAGEGHVIRSVGVMTMNLTDIALAASSSNAAKTPAKPHPPRVSSDNVVRIILAE